MYRDGEHPVSLRDEIVRGKDLCVEFTIHRHAHYEAGSYAWSEVPDETPKESEEV